MFIKRFLFLISIIIIFLLDINILFDDSYDSKEYNYQLKNNLKIIITKGMVKDNILFKLYIPRIKLEKDVYTIDSSENNVDYNIEIERPASLGGGSMKIFLQLDQFLFLNIAN